MQTFLPYADFAKSAQVLDNKRLGKQRVETLQIMRTLTGESSGWKNHPAVRMWRGYENALLHYQSAICDEWVLSRGFADTCWKKTLDALSPPLDYFGLPDLTYTMPFWLPSEALHKSHRSNLLRKDFYFYCDKFEPTLEDSLPYVWPV